jgi:hypothetical protein
MKSALAGCLEQNPDRFNALQAFYRAKNNAGFGIFSTLAGEQFPDGWHKAIECGVWTESGVYGDNFRKTFKLKHV